MLMAVDHRLFVKFRPSCSFVKTSTRHDFILDICKGAENTCTSIFLQNEYCLAVLQCIYDRVIMSYSYYYQLNYHGNYFYPV
jgi:hypothetical protein